MVEEQQTPVYVWGFGSHISESALFDFFDRGRTTSLASVTLHRDAMNNSLRRATLIYNSKVEAEVVSVVRNLQPLDVGKIHTSLKSFPEEAIPPRVEEEQTPVYVWGFGSHVSAMDIFDFFNRGRTASLVSVTLHRDARNNSLRRATLKYRYKEEANAVSIALSGLPLGLGEIHMSLESFPEEAIPPRVVSNQMMTTTTPLTGTGLQASVPLQSYPTYQLFPDQGPQMFPVPSPTFPRRVWVENRREEIRVGMERKSICYVSNFVYELEEAALRDIFRHCGKVQFCKIRRDPCTGRSKGDGFVEFVTPEAASEAIKLDGTLIHGRTMYVSYAKSKKVST